jgi:hypothetical protein
MKTISLILLLSFAAQAQAVTTTDAPTIRVLGKGMVLQDDSVVMSEADAIALANRIQIAERKAATSFDLPIILIAVGLSLAGGIALGYGIRAAAKP